MNIADLKKNIAQALSVVIGPQALSMQDILSLIEVPPEQKLGDFAFPCFKLAKALKKAPPVIAAELASSLVAPRAVTIQATGPYVNFFIDYGSLAPEILSKAGRPPNAASSSRPRTMIEFSQPNTHKAFHVGHCRNVALGDALVRMNRYLGYDVVAANYIGDEGAHIAKCLWYYTKYARDEKPKGDRGEWLGGFYTAATIKLEDATEEEKKIYQQEISDLLKKMESRDPEISKIWNETKKWSMESFYAVYDWLGVHFDHYFYESEVTELAQRIVEDGLKKGVFLISQGAVGVDLNHLGLGFAMVRKSDGTLLYSTRDLALAQKKFEDFKIERSIYVVASEQELHFKQVFKVLELLGFDQVKNCYHLSYGLVMIPEGKMSSRKGTVIYFSALKERILNQIKNVAFKEIDTSDWSEAEKEETARRIAVAAIRYGMIASDPKKTIVFDMNQWLSFQGDTGPYLLYSYVRMNAILRKAQYDHDQFKMLSHEHFDYSIFQGESEKSLLKRVMALNEVVIRAVEEHSPAHLAGFLFDLCQEFNTFYAQTSILKQQDPLKKNAYLGLIDATARTLKTGCGLLGIEPPNRM